MAVDKAICLINGCSKELKPTLSYNLKRYVVIFHKEIAEQHEWTNTISGHKDLDTKEYTVKLNREFIIKNGVSLVTKDGLPVSILNYDSFKNINIVRRST